MADNENENTGDEPGKEDAPAPDGGAADSGNGGVSAGGGNGGGDDGNDGDLTGDDGGAGEVRPISIEEEMKTSYLDYAMSVIVSRALPDVRDGLKPVDATIPPPTRSSRRSSPDRSGGIIPGRPV